MHQQAMRIINKEIEAPTTELSPRERETLTQLSLGQSRAEVADALQISENTLRAYIDSARHKLGALNVTHAVALALARGIIVPRGRCRNTEAAHGRPLLIADRRYDWPHQRQCEVTMIRFIYADQLSHYPVLAELHVQGSGGAVQEAARLGSYCQ